MATPHRKRTPTEARSPVERTSRGEATSRLATDALGGFAVPIILGTPPPSGVVCNALSHPPTGVVPPTTTAGNDLPDADEEHGGVVLPATAFLPHLFAEIRIKPPRFGSVPTTVSPPTHHPAHQEPFASTNSTSGAEFDPTSADPVAGDDAPLETTAFVDEPPGIGLREGAAPWRDDGLGDVIDVDPIEVTVCTERCPEPPPSGAAFGVSDRHCVPQTKATSWRYGCAAVFAGLAVAGGLLVFLVSLAIPSKPGDRPTANPRTGSPKVQSQPTLPPNQGPKPVAPTPIKAPRSERPATAPTPPQWVGAPLHTRADLQRPSSSRADASDDRAQTVEPVARFSEDVSVRAAGDMAPKLRGAVQYPTSVRSFLVPYVGERLTVEATIGPSGQPRVEAVAASFPLSSFVRARFTEAVERSTWVPATDLMGQTVPARVRVVFVVR